MSDKAKLRTGKKNSQYGTLWINDGYEVKKIKKDDLNYWLSLNCKKGRKPNKN